MSEVNLRELLVEVVECLKKQSEQLNHLQIELKAWRETMSEDSGGLFITALEHNRKRLLEIQPATAPSCEEYDAIIQRLRS
jgi:hypothetical protein